MAAKTDQVIILPSDSGNTGKKIRTKESVVGANTVEEYYFIQSSERNSVGQYKYVVPAQAIPAAAQTGTTTGLLYLINPLSSTVNLAIDRLSFKHGFSTTLAVDLIAPLIHVARISFTGTLSAATTTPVKRDTTSPAPQGLLAVAMTGLTVTLVGNVWSFMSQTMDLVTGGAGHWNPMSDEWNPQDEDDELILRPGEGIVVYSTLAVTTANRKIMSNGAWFEFN
jgi:hypothetical protein